MPRRPPLTPLDDVGTQAAPAGVDPRSGTRPRRSGRTLPLVAFVVGAVVIGVLSYVFLAPRAVSVPVPAAAAPGAAPACSTLARALPSTVQGQPGRTVTPTSDRTAAWGEPPIVLRCGVDRPAALVPTSEVYAVDGVDWFSQHLSNGDRFTTTGRVAYVEVTVPSGPDVGVDVLTDLSRAIAASVPRRTDGQL